LFEIPNVYAVEVGVFGALGMQALSSSFAKTLWRGNPCIIGHPSAVFPSSRRSNAFAKYTSPRGKAEGELKAEIEAPGPRTTDDRTKSKAESGKVKLGT
jgi:hypothetical protein